MYQLNQSTLDQISSLNKEKIKLELQVGLQDNESTIYADDSRLKQILYNLLNNAVKFTEKGTIRFGYLLDKNLLKFYVKDTGIGIDSKDFKAIFESFRQVDNSQTRQYEGAGLGLTITKGLVEIMESKLMFKSEPGKGSEFGFTIPMEKLRENGQ
jgi:signal transduction histidine kinase